MSTEKAAPESAVDIGSDDVELDSAIDELRGVLRKGADGPGGAGGETIGAQGSESSGFDEMNAPSANAFADFGDESMIPGAATDASGTEPRLDLIMDIPIDVEIVLGTSRMPVSALMKLSQGSTIALDRKIGEPVEITVNGRVIGRGEITVLEEDETRFGVHLLELDTGKG